MTDEKQKEDLQDLITLEIDFKTYTIPKGYTLATAITYAKEIGYRQTRYGDRRGPVCNMGVCFECSVLLEGRGNVRACMIEAMEGMVVHTSLNYDESHSPTETKVIEGMSSNETMYDVAIIGTGPAGLGAAEELSRSVLHVVMIDEQQHAGGQIYRHVSDAMKKTKPIDLVNRIRGIENVEWIQGNSVWSIIPFTKDGQVSLGRQQTDSYHIYLEGNKKIYAKQLIIATGAYDHMIPFKGWNKPGVMSAGGLQIFAKTQHFLPGNEIVLAGSHPFILIVAKQILESGGTVKGIAFSQHLPHIKEFFQFGMHGLKRWNKSKELVDALVAIKKEKVPIWFHTVPIEAHGTKRISGITFGKVDRAGDVVKNSEFKVDTDTIGMCYGFIASSEIPRQLKCETIYDELNGGHLTIVDQQMKSSKEHVYIAGELTGVGGAELSEIEGRIAGLAIWKDTCPDTFAPYRKKFNSLKKEKQSWASFVNMLGKASMPNIEYVKILDKYPKTYVCRCEEVSYQHIKTLIQENPHLTSLNAIKLMSRCGMGLCQGRYCERTLRKIVESLLPEVSSPIDELTVRYPLKPVIINELITQSDG
ncbi:hypothetical protein DX933_16005 [Ornithinibacillus gellani]|uniref:FAD-dependent oxidoreductase n=1 Tax=Ornithinibacillus gellani TaxID=2293253 RepID=UPI000F4ACB6C|nr:FAD-dependent oxidoreductase [Ornithinibacillus gellani]TQS71178.1 hypothetical protein DX933_16005 [Ornithinibacillus gellani]